jgi:hypothetical protein
MQRYANVAQDTAGNVIPSAIVSVYATGTTNLSTLYSDDALTSKSNPFQTDSDGSFSFYAVNGRYDVKLSKSGYVFDDEVGTDILLYDAPTASSTYIADSGQLYGLVLSNGTDATNDINISPGQAISSETSLVNQDLMLNNVVLTKQLDATWVVGTNAGGRDIGTLVDKTYHVWLIKRPDTGVVDALFSLNAGQSGVVTISIASPGVVTWADHGLQIGSTLLLSTTGSLPAGLAPGTLYYVISAGFTTGSFQIAVSEGGSAINTGGTQSGVHTATAGPLMPANYTKKRRIGSILRESGTIVPFLQYGQDFLRVSGKTDLSSVTNPGTGPTLRAVSIPVGVRVKWRGSLVIQYNASGAIGRLGCPDAFDGTRVIVYTQVAGLLNRGGGETVLTNKSGQISSTFSVSDSNLIATIITDGWYDYNID